MKKKFIKYVYNENQIVLPSITPIDNFKGLLKFFDKMGLYARRFAFEKFESNRWEYVVLPSAFKGLIDKLNVFIQSFGIKPFPINSRSLFQSHIILDKESAEDYLKKWGTGTFQIDASSGDLCSIENPNKINENFILIRREDGNTEINPIIGYTMDILKQKKN